MTEPSRVRRHAPPPNRARGLLALVAVCVLGLGLSGAWLAATAPERWMRMLGLLVVGMASVMAGALYRIWRSWRTQRASNPDQHR